jgi:Fur family ferric uptake transcriptional regulator
LSKQTEREEAPADDGRPDPAVQIQERIRSAGLHLTIPRAAVLRVLTASDTPLSHAEVVDRLEGEGVRPATIYGNLQSLASAGILRRIDFGDHIWRFELAPSRKARYSRERLSFVCSECGSVSRLAGTTVTLKPSPDAPRCVSEGLVETQLRGVCDRCR